jgi:hypothetical protein
MLLAGLAGAVCITGSVLPAAADPAAAACGSALSAAELATVAALSDTGTLDGTPLQRLDDAVDRNRRIAQILAAHGDRRGLFPLGLDVVERRAVLPLQHDPAAFADPGYAQAISLELIRRFLAAVHAEFTGGTVEPHWAHYFDLAGRCEVSPARAAMAGYNAHLTVDLAYSVAAVGTRQENAADYFKIVDAIASVGFAIVDRTRQVYGADLGPLWRFYFLGESLDLLVGRGVATGPLLRAADLGYNVIIFGNGLALQQKGIRDGVGAGIGGLFAAAETAFDVLAALRGL